MTLAARFSSSGLKGHALLREFSRHKELVRRELVFKELAPARETLLAQLEQQLELLSEDFGTRTSQAAGKNGTSDAKLGKNLPEVVEHLTLSKQLAERISELLATSGLLLSDLQGMARFMARAGELHQ